MQCNDLKNEAHVDNDNKNKCSHVRSNFSGRQRIDEQDSGSRQQCSSKLSQLFVSYLVLNKSRLKDNVK